ncbi:MAG: hypothetical protein AB1540_17600 [Bdellovibrionota bacterium]
MKHGTGELSTRTFYLLWICVFISLFIYETGFAGSLLLKEKLNCLSAFKHYSNGAFGGMSAKNEEFVIFPGHRFDQYGLHVYTSEGDSYFEAVDPKATSKNKQIALLLEKPKNSRVDIIFLSDGKKLNLRVLGRQTSQSPLNEPIIHVQNSTLGAKNAGDGIDAEIFGSVRKAIADQGALLGVDHTTDRKLIEKSLKDCEQVPGIEDSLEKAKALYEKKFFEVDADQVRRRNGIFEVPKRTGGFQRTVPK